jgi:alpha-glucosidase
LGRLTAVDGSVLSKLLPGKLDLCYQVTFKNQPVILESELDIRIDNHLSEQALGIKPLRCQRWCDDLVVQDISHTSHDSYWQPVYGERSRIRDNYNQLVIQMVRKDRPNYQLHLIVELITRHCFQYFFGRSDSGLLSSDCRKHGIYPSADTKAWFTAWAQGLTPFCRCRTGWMKANGR